MPTLSMDHVQDREIPAYGDTYRDITRPGADGYRRTYTGQRGTRVSVRCHSFETSQANATAKIATIEGYKGSDITLQDTGDSLSWDVYVHDVRCRWRRVVHSDGSSTHQVLATLDVEATA